MAPEEDPEIFSYEAEPDDEDWENFTPAQIVAEFKKLSPEDRVARYKALPLSDEERREVKDIWNKTSKAGEHLFPREKERQREQTKEQQPLFKQKEAKRMEKEKDFVQMKTFEIADELRKVPAQQRWEYFRERTGGKNLEANKWDAVNFELVRLTGTDIKGNERDIRDLQKARERQSREMRESQERPSREVGESNEAYQARMLRLGVVKSSKEAKTMSKEFVEEKKPNVKNIEVSIAELIKNRASDAEKARWALQRGIDLENHEMQEYDNILFHKQALGFNPVEVKVLETHREQELQQRTVAEGLVHKRGQEILTESKKARGEPEEPTPPSDLEADLLYAKANLAVIEKKAVQAREQKLKVNMVELLAARADFRDLLKQRHEQQKHIEQKGYENLEKDKTLALLPVTKREEKAQKQVDDLGKLEKQEKNLEKLRKVKESLSGAQATLSEIRGSKKELLDKFSKRELKMKAAWEKVHAKTKEEQERLRQAEARLPAKALLKETPKQKLSKKQEKLGEKLEKQRQKERAKMEKTHKTREKRFAKIQKAQQKQEKHKQKPKKEKKSKEKKNPKSGTY